MEESFDDNGEWKYTPVEQECINSIESLPDPENEYENEKNQHDKRLWVHFQSAALAIAQFYKDPSSSNLWNSFQQASTNLATLYKECSEFQKRNFEHIRQNGVHKRNKELLTWAKKKKNFIRREDLLSFLSGRNYSTPLHNHIFQKYPRASRQARNSEEFSRYLNPSQQAKTSSIFLFDEALGNSSPSSSIDTNLTTFTQALSRSNRRNSPRNDVEDLSEFINQEYQRHVVIGSDNRKRPSSMDVCMDSPTHNKRTKFY